MLIPRFSLRGLLGLTTVCGLFFFVMSYAYRGSHWAIAIVIAIGSLLVAAIVYALMFFVAWSTAALVHQRPRPARTRSPFAGESPSPQVIAPVDPD